MKKTLENFLKNNAACKDGVNFAKDLTLEEFLNTCERGDWILWLFARMNPESLRELTSAKGHCANTVRALMSDKRSRRAVDVAIAFGEGKATREELTDAAAATAGAWAAADAAAWTAAWADADDADARVGAWAAAKKQNQKLTAGICKQYLPLKIWNQNLI